MLNRKLAKRYAKALIEIGREQNQIEQFKNELKVFSESLKKFPELKQRLLSPLYSAEDLKKVIGAITEKLALSRTINNFLYLLVDKRRIYYIGEIIETYEDLSNEIFGYVKAKVVTATVLPEESHNQIKKSLENMAQKKILLFTIVEPRIIGGVIAEVGDKIFDGSIRSQLQKIGETLI